MWSEQIAQNEEIKIKKQLNCIISSDDDLPDGLLCDQTCFCLNVTDGNTHGVWV